MCVTTVQEWLADPANHASQKYRWRMPRTSPVTFCRTGSPYDQAIALREALHKELLRQPENTDELVSWFAMRWGGVTSGNPNRFGTFTKLLREGRLPESMDGIASWSKAAAVMQPRSYAIYDSRVSVSLCLIQAAACGTVCVPFPLGHARPGDTKKASHSLREDFGLKFIHARTKISAYQSYLELLSAQDDIQSAEMALFAAAPDLAARYLRQRKKLH